MNTQRAGFFDRLYLSEREPWDYSGRAAEVLRMHWVAETAGAFRARNALDLGCSLGLMTDRVRLVVETTIAADISPTAVLRARQNLAESRPAVPQPRFVAASATDLPFARAFDLVIASDGLHSWRLDEVGRMRTLREIAGVMLAGGHAIITEHLRPEQFESFVSEISAAPLHIVSVTYLFDGPWYRFESWFKAIRHWRISRRILGNLAFARWLAALAARRGPRASRHICVVARRTD